MHAAGHAASANAAVAGIAIGIALAGVQHAYADYAGMCTAAVHDRQHREDTDVHSP